MGHVTNVQASAEPGQRGIGPDIAPALRGKEEGVG